MDVSCCHFGFWNFVFFFILLIFVTLLGLKVRGGSAGVVESFYGVIKPIPIV
jgi:hypothetical protein